MTSIQNVWLNFNVAIISVKAECFVNEKVVSVKKVSFKSNSKIDLI